MASNAPATVGLGDTSTTMTATGEDAADSPVRQLRELLGVGPRVLDVWELRRGAVLAPADALVAVVDEDLVHRSILHVSLFERPVALHSASFGESFRMEADAPATTPDATVRLD